MDLFKAIFSEINVFLYYFNRSDVITREEAVQILRENEQSKNERENFVKTKGYPAYTTQIGWLGYSDEKLKNLCQKYLSLGFNGFKIKVGENLDDDKRRCRIVREAIGKDKYLVKMLDNFLSTYVGVL